MGFLASTMLSGMTYDLVKAGMKLTAKFLKEKLKDWIFEEEDYEKLANAINSATETDKSTQKCWEAFLDSNETVNTILQRAQKAENNSVVQNFSNAKFENVGVAGVGNLHIGTFTQNINSNDDDSKKK